MPQQVHLGYYSGNIGIFLMIGVTCAVSGGVSVRFAERR